MMDYEIVTLENKEKWDRIVRSFKNYDVQYLSNYVEAFKYCGEGDPLLFYFNNNTLRAVNVVMRRDISLNSNFKSIIPGNTFFDLVTPYGYGGFVFEGDNPDSAISEYNNYIKTTGYISEFVRFNLFYKAEQHFNGDVESTMSNVVRSLDLPFVDISSDFEYRLKKNLKKVRNNDFEVIIDEEGTTLISFLEVYYATMDRNNAIDKFYFSDEFFKIINKMVGNYFYIHVLYNQEVVASELVIYGSENCYSFLGGTKREYLELRPNDLLKLEIIKFAQKKGLKHFVLGGGYGSDDGIFNYKKSFSPSGIQPFYTGKKIINSDTYNKLLNLKSGDDDTVETSSFFPKYRT